jgi:pyruvate formate lyase activating enzyme
MQIKGLQKTTLIDYPGKMASIVFLPNCNFNCGFCFNKALVKESQNIPNISEKEFFDFLENRKKWIDGVVITGGEPTLQKDLPEFIKKIKALGLLVKLDTNGSNPTMLEKLLEEKLVDFVAMDIKTSTENYEKAAGSKVDLKKIKKSAELIMQKALDYEFRTTTLPKFFSKQDAEKIGLWLNGAKMIALQQFKDEADLIDETLRKEKKYSDTELKELATILEKYFKKVEIRN